MKTDYHRRLVAEKIKQTALYVKTALQRRIRSFCFRHSGLKIPHESLSTRQLAKRAVINRSTQAKEAGKRTLIAPFVFIWEVLQFLWVLAAEMPLRQRFVVIGSFLSGTAGAVIVSLTIYSIYTFLATGSIAVASLLALVLLLEGLVFLLIGTNGDLFYKTFPAIKHRKAQQQFEQGQSQRGTSAGRSVSRKRN